MEKLKKMTSEEVAEFFHQVKRKGKALSLPADQLDKYRNEYDRIVAYLKKNYRGFLFYHISGGSNMVNKDTFNRALKVMESRGLFQNTKFALIKGDAEDLAVQCAKLRPCYLETVNQMLWEDKQKRKK